MGCRVNGMHEKLDRLLGRETQINKRLHKGTFALHSAQEPRYGVSVTSVDEVQRDPHPKMPAALK
jgi:hypothetical protein